MKTTNTETWLTGIKSDVGNSALYQCSFGKQNLEVWRKTACSRSVLFTSSGRERYESPRTLARVFRSNRRASFFKSWTNLKTPLHQQIITRFQDGGRKP